MITPINYMVVDDYTFAQIARKQGIQTEELEDLTGRVPHAGFGGAEKSRYVSKKNGATLYVLERNCWHSDSCENKIWTFDRDFTAAEASEFLSEIDRSKP